MKSDMPPLALPAKQYMSHARELWDRLGLPPLRPEQPWHGYSLGDWTKTWEDAALRAVQGEYLENGRRSAQRQLKGLIPETSVRDAEDGWD